MATQRAGFIWRLTRPCFSNSNCTRSFSTGQPVETVGFVGLGNMGFHMAKNLSRAGFKLIVHDRCDEVMEKIAENGAQIAHSPSEITEASDAVITMLPSPAEVMDVYVGSKGLLSKKNNIKPWLMLDSSTVDSYTSRLIAERVSSCARSTNTCSWESPVMLDAPVSGGIKAAQAGTLTFMVGGPQKGFLAAKPLFLAMGSNIIDCGESGNGSAAKLCNNLAMAVSMAGVSEAFVLGQHLGISAKTLTKIFNSSSARSWCSDSYNPVPGVIHGVPASKDYEGGFSCNLMKKDLLLALAAIKEEEISMPLTSKVHEMYSTLCENEKGNKDFSCIFHYYYSGHPEE